MDLDEQRHQTFMEHYRIEAFRASRDRDAAQEDPEDGRLLQRLTCEVR
jgi:hypothetical protein